ncbi:pyridoxamine 5'-phosphate oxidase family protein [Actinoplanes siamensis]|uniref:Pyridoxamine 5'-phosphate oxidase n=1 Tax=Actinoplanes siamensis TaxID=1223317 RepID=A0A919TIJ8_9ACTN|nr:pyridoxamine 5'-phosphate oxidase family protein [Actinoplanes siamensis]GIF03820.1 hypothetical protein Asi03nite_13580 [Actinoplanes siamensis]
MRETPEELADLQRLLDASLGGATTHLKSVVAGRTITAEQLAGVLTGMCVLSVSTVTAKGEPRISAVDGHFLHGKWIFGTARTAAKARHLVTRPAASVSHLRGEDLGVFVHGRTEILDLTEEAEISAYVREFYGDDAFDWENDVVYFRLRPHFMTVYAPDLTKLR